MVTPERIRRYAELQRFPGNREATLQRARTQEPLDPTPLKRSSKVPTLIICGRQGSLGAGWPTPSASRATSRAPSSEIFEQLGHNPMEGALKRDGAPVVAAFLATAHPRKPPAPSEPDSNPAADSSVQPAVVPEKD